MLKWRTLDGRAIPLNELDDEHLISILRMLKRNAIMRLGAIQARYLLIPPPDGDAAYLAYEEESDRLFEMSWKQAVSPCFPFLKREAEHRKLRWDNTSRHQDEQLLTHFALTALEKTA